MYYAAEDLHYASSDVADTRRSKARQIAAGIAGDTSQKAEVFKSPRVKE
jgi:hypothetical protein